MAAKSISSLKLTLSLALMVLLSACAQNGSGPGLGSNTAASEGAGGAAGSAQGCTITGSSIPEATLQIFAELCTLTNQARQVNGIAPLTINLAITYSAQSHAVDMATRNFFSHTNPDGLDPFQRLARDGVSYGAAGENIAYGQNSPTSVMNAWMNSSGHRANILNGSFHKLGLGFYQGRWVQVFTD